jgi:hypothetical protein
MKLSPMNQGKTIVLETVRLYLVAELKIALRRTPLSRTKWLLCFEKYKTSKQNNTTHKVGK